MYGDRATRPLALSLGLDASPSKDKEATLVTLETLKGEHHDWVQQERAKLQVPADRGEGRREL